MKIVAIVQARMGSTRLPGKVLCKVKEKPIIELVLTRLAKSKRIDEIVIATTSEQKDDLLVNFLKKFDVTIYRGSSQDVLSRYFHAASTVGANVVVRITADCPLIDPELVDQVIEEYLSGTFDYVSNTLAPSFPDGLDVEVFSFNALEKANKEASSQYEREHVTPFLKNELQFSVQNITFDADYSNERWTIDEKSDLDALNKILSLTGLNPYAGWHDIIAHPDYKDLDLDNRSIIRNEGEKMSDGQKLWKRAKRLIPGGNMLLSKRPEMFLPEQWPSYFTKASDCYVWDLNGTKFTDVSIMGIGTNLLGYGNPHVDEAVSKCISNGNMSTLNAPEEVYLAEELVRLHPWAEMVRFARTGGEANAVAVRIARAASGRSGVAVCGYHGWHDWYLATNLTSNNELNTHLLPGLDPAGVPTELCQTVYPFEYNNLEQLERLVQEQSIGVVVMEVMRNYKPKNNFLQHVRDLCDSKGIVLIFDECTSGFREALGGLHLKFGVIPDMAMFGKALGNGYAITAVLGKQSVMDYAQSSFISSTFWTERIGSVAALATLRVMGETKSWEVVTQLGNRIKDNWQAIANQNGVEITVSGLPALASFNFSSLHDLRKTYFIQEMLKDGYLASNSFYASLAHTDQILDDYFIKCDEIFARLAQFDDAESLLGQIQGPICHNGFKRLN